MTGRLEVHPRRLGTSLIAIAFLGAVIGGVGAPLITSVAVDLDVPLETAQWTLTVTLFAGAISAPVLGRLGAGAHRRTTLLVTLTAVAAGGLLTAIPAPFIVLVIGRALQGFGLGAVALLMSTARDHLSAERAQSVVATIAVASTVGIGVAYPMMGLLDQLGGPRIAYAVGGLLSVIAVVLAWLVLPYDPPGPRPSIDVPGALLLSLGVLGVLIVVAAPSVWNDLRRGLAVLACAAVALTAWVRVERRAATPLVDIRLLTGGVLRANSAMLIAGAGMYLLFSLLTRNLQTPGGACYGFGLSGVAAGAALIPFSALGFIAGRLAPRLMARRSAPRAFSLYTATVIVAAGLFTIAPDSLATVLASMSLLGFGVGGASAVMPKLVLDGVPPGETASVLSINQIARTVGFSIGSALAGLLLAASTPDGALVPSEHGYVIAAVWTLPLLVLSVAAVLTRRRT